MSSVVCVERDDAAPVTPTPTPDAGLRALCGIAAYYRIAADPTHLQRELALLGREAGVTDLMRASGVIGLKARRVARTTEKQLAATPAPAIARLREGGFAVFGGRLPDGRFRLVDPVTSIDRAVSAEEFFAAVEPQLLLVGRRVGGAGYDPKSFGFRWFLPSVWRYRRPLMHVLLASLFVQVFALVTPLFFQVVVDKVLSHKGYSTLIVLTIGIVLVGLFDVVLQYLRTYALTHTTNRIDVELGQRLFRHLLHLPLSYFETRAAGQTVARVRELENVRAFLTGQGLFSALDLVFAIVFIAVLFAYSWKLTHHRGAVHPALHAGGAGLPADPAGDGPREVQRQRGRASSSWSRPWWASRPSRPRRSSPSCSSSGRSASPPTSGSPSRRRSSRPSPRTASPTSAASPPRS